MHILVRLLLMGLLKLQAKRYLRCSFYRQEMQIMFASLFMQNLMKMPLGSTN
ncbi:hypothetical protein P353_22555 [Comamonas testosteroni]|uniref:Uncharacterized protein n=1 Tax=Comamonas testosteroni TaxID=285 RepID=A0A096F8D7_COMTE|nr:hypothetical protein P353_22555 [Comamonas testosteroni]